MAGRELYKMYAAGKKTKINYPKPKTAKWDPVEAAKKPKKPCPQKTQIEYPKVTTKQELAYKKHGPKFHKVDLIPKRKNYKEILE